MPGVRSMIPVSPEFAFAMNGFHQQMNAQAQREIERHRAIFDQQVVVALAAIDDRDRSVVGMADDGRAGFARPMDRGSGDLIVGPGDGDKADGVAGLELAHLPQLVARDDRRADEAAEAGAVGAEDDRHVAGEVDGADGIGVVVEVGRMQAGLAAIGARPFRRRADEADAGAGAS